MPIVVQDLLCGKKLPERKGVLPVVFYSQFFVSDLLSNIVKVCGQFRWELCRTIEGTAWNNITYKSLTSEYSIIFSFIEKQGSV